MSSGMNNYGGLWRVLYVVLLGQSVSLSMALMSFTSSLSANLGVSAPLALAFFAYLPLTLVFGNILLYRRQKLQISWYWYALLAFVDVQGNFFVNKAFQFSSITSVTIFDCATVIWVIILTWFFLGAKYSLWQFLGAALCVSGLCLVLLSDSGVGGGGGTDPVLGDALVIAGTCFFAFSNVGEEYCVKKVGRIEVIAMLGLFGMLVSLIEMALFESKTLKSISWSPEVILIFAGFGISGFMFNSLTPLVLQIWFSAIERKGKKMLKTYVLNLIEQELKFCRRVEPHYSISRYSLRICGQWSFAYFYTTKRWTGYTMCPSYSLV